MVERRLEVKVVAKVEMQVVLEVEEKVNVWMNDVAEAVPVPVKMTVKQGR